MGIEQEMKVRGGIPAKYHRIARVQVVIEHYYTEEARRDGEMPVDTVKLNFENMPVESTVERLTADGMEEEIITAYPNNDVTTELYKKLMAGEYAEGEKV